MTLLCAALKHLILIEVQPLFAACLLPRVYTNLTSLTLRELGLSGAEDTDMMNNAVVGNIVGE